MGGDFLKRPCSKLSLSSLRSSPQQPRASMKFITQKELNLIDYRRPVQEYYPDETLVEDYDSHPKPALIKNEKAILSQHTRYQKCWNENLSKRTLNQLKDHRHLR
jgi:hypothetical protein